MLEKSLTRIEQQVIKVKIKAVEVLKSERGTIDIFTTKLGLGVLSVIVVGILIGAVKVTAPDVFETFKNYMLSEFGL